MALSRDRMREYVQEKRAVNRAYAIEKLGGRCAECGSTDELEFDHIDPDTKETNISLLFSNARATLDAELEKCQLLCSSCHDKKTSLEWEQEKFRKRVHGTHFSVIMRKCKCEVCVGAKPAILRTINDKRKRRKAEKRSRV